MLNRADGSVVGLSDPAFDGFVIVPSDSVGLEGMTRALWIGTGGDLTVETGGGTILMFKNVASGSILPVQVTKVFVTGTTALNMVGLV